MGTVNFNEESYLGYNIIYNMLCAKFKFSFTKPR